MATKTKTFDCIAMKDRIQAELIEEQARGGEEEIERRHREWLDQSDDPLAAWWRSARHSQPDAAKLKA